MCNGTTTPRGGRSLQSLHDPAASVWFPDEDRAEILRMIDESLRTGRLTLGPIGERLEHEFAVRHGAAHAVAVASGTSALEIVLRSVGVEGREAIVPANTFHATAAAVLAAADGCASPTATRPPSPSTRRPWPHSSTRRRRR